MRMANAVNKQERTTLIHSLIGVIIMIFFRFLPISLPEVTDVGMEVLGIFLGTLYLWTFVDPLWGSLLSIAMLGFSSYSNMSAILSSAFGSPVVAQVFYMMIMSGGLAYYKITAYIGRFFLTRKFTNGKPWLLMGVIGVLPRGRQATRKPEKNKLQAQFTHGDEKATLNALSAT